MSTSGRRGSPSPGSPHTPGCRSLQRRGRLSPQNRGCLALEGSLKRGIALWVQRRENNLYNPSLWQCPLQIFKSLKSVGLSDRGRPSEPTPDGTGCFDPDIPPAAHWPLHRHGGDPTPWRTCRGLSTGLSSEPVADLQEIINCAEVFQKLVFALEKKLQAFLGNPGP